MGRYYRTASPQHIDYWYKPPVQAMERASALVEKRTDVMLNSIDGLKNYFNQKNAEAANQKAKTSNVGKSIGVDWLPGDAERASKVIADYENQIDELAKGLIGDVLNPAKYQVKFRELRSNIRNDILGGELATYRRQKTAFEDWKKRQEDAGVPDRRIALFGGKILSDYMEQGGANYDSQTGDYKKLDLPELSTFDLEEAVDFALKKVDKKDPESALFITQEILNDADYMRHLKNTYDYLISDDVKKDTPFEEWSKEYVGYTTEDDNGNKKYTPGRTATFIYNMILDKWGIAHPPGSGRKSSTSTKKDKPIPVTEVNETFLIKDYQDILAVIDAVEKTDLNYIKLFNPIHAAAVYGGDKNKIAAAKNSYILPEVQKMVDEQKVSYAKRYMNISTPTAADYDSKIDSFVPQNEDDRFNAIYAKLDIDLKENLIDKGKEYIKKNPGTLIKDYFEYVSKHDIDVVSLTWNTNQVDNDKYTPAKKESKDILKDYGSWRNLQITVSSNLADQAGRVPGGIVTQETLEKAGVITKASNLESLKEEATKAAGSGQTFSQTRGTTKEVQFLNLNTIKNGEKLKYKIITKDEEGNVIEGDDEVRESTDVLTIGQTYQNLALEYDKAAPVMYSGVRYLSVPVTMNGVSGHFMITMDNSIIGVKDQIGGDNLNSYYRTPAVIAQDWVRMIKNSEPEDGEVFYFPTNDSVQIFIKIENGEPVYYSTSPNQTSTKATGDYIEKYLSDYIVTYLLK